MKLALIAAVARNGCIGRDGELPFRLPEDQQHFRRVTIGHPVIMGRKTWDSLPPRFRPLPGRRNIVVTRNPRWQPDGAEAAASLQAALASVGHEPAAFVIGGGELYREALPRADELVLTEIDRDIDGDTFFPAWDRSQFEMLNRETHHAAPPNDFDFAFATYRRIAG
ncbi:MAG: dihydrofolate reductase [Burkholderiaceae bacterium]|nr:dihydrofolate reductase [Burkholderiaceae bacterium]